MNDRSCQFSPDRRYRYTLWREWDMLNTSYLMVIGLNPSTADETRNDPTIVRCIGFAKLWGFGALCMTNLFAFRATKPIDMLAIPDPIGPENDKWLRQSAIAAGMIIAAWGTKGAHMERADHVQTMIWCGLKCLRKNADGSPEHPLYVPASTQPIPF
jgi:hypothetical protein